ncbi:MAG: hypothetical protein M1828_001476 [Chrysothrix sp. TS-e1954]|nr:MAG: hypothetical protein M1828_001476 [Chrysothrix sp. TS-e1954]
MTSKGPGEARTYDGASLRIGIIHSRWNTSIITALVSGARKALLDSGVPASNITVQSVPGSYELPLAVQRMHAASTASTSTQLVSAATDLLSSASTSDLTGSSKSGEADTKEGKTTGGALDAIIAIGVLIKGQTMHFEYIADAVSHGLMKVQLETSCPIIFGLLTCSNEEQAMTRAGLESSAKGDASGKSGSYAEQGHNHGEDWGRAAVEMGVKRKAWGEGRFVE